MQDLAHMRVLVTRPKPQGNLLCEKIIALGGQPVYLPVIEFAPPNDAAVLDKQLAQIMQYDWLFFVSSHAVECFIYQLQQRQLSWPAQLKLAAIGAGTAHALRAHSGKEIVYPLDEWTSEGLLKLPCFQELYDQKIALVCGQGGREHLAETLNLRGATVSRWEMYQRVLPIYSDLSEYIALFHQQKIDIIVSTSGESLHNLLTLLSTVPRSKLLNVCLLVVSQRLVQLAAALGFKKIFLANSASDSMIIDALCLIKGNNYVSE